MEQGDRGNRAKQRRSSRGLWGSLRNAGGRLSCFYAPPFGILTCRWRIVKGTVTVFWHLGKGTVVLKRSTELLGGRRRVLFYILAVD